MKKLRIIDLAYACLAVFIHYDMWFDIEIFAAGRIFTTSSTAFDNDNARLLYTFTYGNNEIFVHCGRNPYTDLSGNPEIFSINLGSSDYVYMYSHSPYQDVLLALQAAADRYNAYFDFGVDGTLHLYTE